MALIGVAQSIYLATNNTLVQLAVPDALQGRVMSVYMTTWGLMPLGALPQGILADWFGAPVVLGGVGPAERADRGADGAPEPGAARAGSEDAPRTPAPDPHPPCAGEGESRDRRRMHGGRWAQQAAPLPCTAAEP